MEGNAFSRFFRWLGKDLKEVGLTFAEGDWKTRLSFLIMGFGQLLRGQLVRGLSMLALEGGILYYVISFGWGYLKNILTLGVIVDNVVAFPFGINENVHSVAAD